MGMHYRGFDPCQYALLARPVPVHAQQATNKERKFSLLGPLDSLKATSGHQTTYLLGEHPSSFSTITPERMWLLFVDSSREGCHSEPHAVGWDVAASHGGESLIEPWPARGSSR